MSQTTFKGKIITDEDVRKAMEEFDRDLRSSFAKWRIYGIRSDGKDYPPKEILKMIVGDAGKLPPGGEATNHYFRDLGFEIVETDDPGTEPVSNDAIIEDALDTSLSLERDLENNLVADLSKLEPGLKLYQQDAVSGQQLHAEAAGRIDILAVDQNDDLVVIELKAGDADRQVCGQIQAYMGWAKEKLAGQKKVRGIIIANEFTERLRLAASVVPGLTLKKYAVSFKFTDL